MTESATRIPVLMYHRVGPIRNAGEMRYSIAPDRFEAHMDALAEDGMRAVSIEDFWDWLQGAKPLPDGSFVLTFDDGYADLHHYAMPVLIGHDWPATVFLVSALIGKEDEWCRDLYDRGNCHALLTTDQIRDMARQRISFHSHTRHHLSLPELDETDLTDEIAGSKQELEEMLGKSVRYLAYPFGHFDERAVTIARGAGYRAAFSVRSGFNRPDIDVFRIRRIDVFGTDSPVELRRKVRLGTNDGSLGHTVAYYARRAAHRLGLTAGD